jgi:hypothetical protein
MDSWDAVDGAEVKEQEDDALEIFGTGGRGG